MTRVLVTGASGFVGRALLPALLRNGDKVRALGSPSASDPLQQAERGATPVEWHRGDLRIPEALPPEVFEKVEVVLHLAALAHVPRSTLRTAAADLRRINVLAPTLLAERAAAAGARRLVFVSSALVHGDRSTGSPLTESAALAPVEAYGASKAEAEARLHEACGPRGLELTVVRPPLVYGPRAKGNFARLLAWAMAGRPVPRALCRNSRSFVGLTNLCSLLVLAAHHPAAANETYLVSDQEDLSTGELYRRTALRAGAQPRFWPLSPGPVALALRWAGRAALAQRLLGDLRIDSTKASRELAWRPVARVEDELDRAIAWQRSSGG